VDVADEWDVPLMVTRGDPSMSFLYSAAEAIRERSENGQRTHIYYLGDRDPSGLDIDRSVVEGDGNENVVGNGEALPAPGGWRVEYINTLTGGTPPVATAIALCLRQ
jgi:hypothetical protein